MKHLSVKVAGFVAVSLLFVSADSVVAGNKLAERTVVPSPAGFPISGNTTGLNSEAGEINEAGAPAAATDQSAWYEWTPAETGVARLKAAFEPTGSRPARGLAAYTLADDSAPVTMASLVPAGAVVLPVATQDRSMLLRVTAGRKVILRVWTARMIGYGYSTNVPFSVSLIFQEQSQREPGDLPETAVPLAPYQVLPDGTTVTYQFLGMPSLASKTLTVEAADNLIGGQFYPSGTVFWYRWKSGRGDTVRLSLADTFSWPGSETIRFTSLMVLDRPFAGGALNLVAGPSDSLTFTPLPNKEYLLRIALSLPDEDAHFDEITLQGGPIPPGDEHTTPLSLAPGGSALVVLVGALPASEPDVWFDLGNNLSGIFSLRVNANHAVNVYRTDGSGVPSIPVVGNDRSEDLNFLAESGRRYFARVFMRGPGFPEACDVSLTPQTIVPPANDRRAAAEVIPAEGQVLLYRDATGASAEESDWPGASSSDDRSGTSVWYALDVPAGGTPWFVWAWGGGEASLYREQNGSLVSADDGANRFVPNGSRIWIKVTSDTKFMLMAGPAVTPGDDIADAVPLIPGETRILYTGGATGNSPAPGLTGPDTLWFSWNAEQSGSVVLSTRGSPFGQWKPAVFTAALEPVETKLWNSNVHRGSTDVLSFDAIAGKSYRIVLNGHLEQPAIVRLQPGGWESPYDLFLQGFPAWKDVSSLTNPLADADADGMCNLLEMALGGSPLSWNRHGGSPSSIGGHPPRLGFFLQEQVWALRGAPGSRPFTLTLESSPDMHHWTEVSHTIHPMGEHINQHRFEWRAGAANDPPAQYFRLRVHR